MPIILFYMPGSAGALSLASDCTTNDNVVYCSWATSFMLHSILQSRHWAKDSISLHSGQEEIVYNSSSENTTHPQFTIQMPHNFYGNYSRKILDKNLVSLTLF